MRSYTCSLRLALCALALLFGLEGSGMMIGNTGAFLTGKLPYDAEVEYLESTGTQWIETGIYGDDKILAQCGWSYKNSSAYTAPFGTRTSVLTKAFGIVGDGAAANKNLYVEYSTANQAYMFYNGTDVYAHQWDVQLGKVGNSWSSWLKKDGATVASSTATPSVFKTNETIPLFAFKQAGNMYLVNGGQRIRYFRVLQGGNAILDLIPVRFTNEFGVSEGAMYDRLGTGGMNPDGSPRTDGLYRNRGTGAFTWVEKSA